MNLCPGSGRVVYYESIQRESTGRLRKQNVKNSEYYSVDQVGQDVLTMLVALSFILTVVVYYKSKARAKESI
jgi:hypothetical protein